MKRLALVILSLSIAAPLFAITGQPVRGNRIGVLRIAERYDGGPEQAVAESVQRDLQDELRRLGFDAFASDRFYDDLRRADDHHPAYWVEIVSGHASDRGAGEIGVGGNGIAGTIGIVVSSVAAEVRLYDGRSPEMIRSFDLRHRSTSVAPTGIGVGGPWSWLWVGVPLFRSNDYRSAAQAVAHDAARQIAEVARQ